MYNLLKTPKFCAIADLMGICTGNHITSSSIRGERMQADLVLCPEEILEQKPITVSFTVVIHSGHSQWSFRTCSGPYMVVATPPSVAPCSAELTSLCSEYG